jgi:plastocyanin
MSARRLAAGRVAAAFAVPALLALVLTGCSNGSSSVNRAPHAGTATATPVDGVQRVTLTVGEDDRFHPSTIVVHRGRVQITLKHDDAGAPHDWSLTGFPGDYVGIVNGGQTRSTTFTAPAPGTYPFVCTIHAKLGMTGSLVVRP